ncbi:MAG: serine kinase [Candidatus Aminicenantes bacterium]|nr:serine kinase [Candidatus Aminicenantes bacterium]
MLLQEIVRHLNLNIFTANLNLEVEVTGGYTSDLLSDVIANAQEGNLWITLQVHPNVVAVGKLKDLAGIILVNNRQPEEETRRKAEEENLPLLGTKENAFIISGKLYALLTQKT